MDLRNKPSDDSSFNTSGSKTTDTNQSEHNQSDKKKHLMDSMSLDDFKKAIVKKNVNVKWTGTKFEPKPFDLYRINMRQLSSSSEVYYKRIITSKLPSTQKIEIRPDLSHKVKSDKHIGLMLYEDILEKINNTVEMFDAKIEELKNQLNTLKNNFTELNQYSHGQFDKHIPIIAENSNKIGAVQNQVNQLQGTHNDLNGLSRGHFDNILPQINALNEFKNAWAENLPFMFNRTHISKRNDFAIMQCTDELSTYGKPVGCLIQQGYIE